MVSPVHSCRNTWQTVGTPIGHNAPLAIRQKLKDLHVGFEMARQLKIYIQSGQFIFDTDKLTKLGIILEILGR